MTKIPVLVFGRGQIGKLIKSRYRESKKFSVFLSDADITNDQQVHDEFERYQPQIVINTAAKTNLEYCGRNKEDAFRVNVLGANKIAKKSDQFSAYFIHFSSGCIFQSFSEEDEKYEDSIVDPQSYYSLTKVWSEQIIPFEKSSDFRYLILRPRQPISTNVNKMNMLVKMLAFKKFVDTPNTGTVIEDLLDWLEIIWEKQPLGILHAANPGVTTPYKIGLLLKKHILPELEPEKITKAELDALTPNKRVDTVLNVDRLQKVLGEKLPSYEQRLEEVIIELGRNIKKMRMSEESRKELTDILTNTAAMVDQRSISNNVWQNLIEKV